MGEPIPLQTSENNRPLRGRERSPLPLELTVGDLPNLTRLLMDHHHNDDHDVTSAAGWGNLMRSRMGAYPMILACCRMSMDLRILMRSSPELARFMLTMKDLSRCAFALGPRVVLTFLECLSRRLPGLNPGSGLLSSSLACTPGMRTAAPLGASTLSALSRPIAPGRPVGVWCVRALV